MQYGYKGGVMDRKEAIQVLQTALTAPFVYGAYANAINMAIEALSQPNYETDTEVRLVVTNRKKEKVILWDAYGEVEYYPIEALSVEPTVEKCEIPHYFKPTDLISRAAAIKAVANAIWHYPNECYRNLNVYDMAEALAKDAIMPLPSVNVPTKCIAQININTDEIVKKIKNEYEIDNRPSAEWIMHIDDLYPEESTQECSNCHEHETIKIHNDDYCPSCGARMNKGIK